MTMRRLPPTTIAAYALIIVRHGGNDRVVQFLWDNEDGQTFQGHLWCSRDREWRPLMRGGLRFHYTHVRGLLAPSDQRARRIAEADDADPTARVKRSLENLRAAVARARPPETVRSRSIREVGEAVGDQALRGLLLAQDSVAISVPPSDVLSAYNLLDVFMTTHFLRGPKARPEGPSEGSSKDRK